VKTWNRRGDCIIFLTVHVGSFGDEQLNDFYVIFHRGVVKREFAPTIFSRNKPRILFQ